MKNAKPTQSPTRASAQGAVMIAKAYVLSCAHTWEPSCGNVSAKVGDFSVHCAKSEAIALDELTKTIVFASA